MSEEKRLEKKFEAARSAKDRAAKKYDYLRAALGAVQRREEAARKRWFACFTRFGELEVSLSSARKQNKTQNI